jgi:hypothetical protein
MAEPSGNRGFALPRAEQTLSRRAVALELLATVTLTVSLIAAVTVMSIDDKPLARSDRLGQLTSAPPPGR